MRTSRPWRRPISPVQEQLQSHQSEVREEPWEFSLAIDSDKNDTSMAIVSDASEPIIGFRDDPSADPPLDGFWGGFDTVTGKINIHVRTGAIFTGICKPNRDRRHEHPNGPAQARTRSADGPRQHARQGMYGLC